MKERMQTWLKTLEEIEAYLEQHPDKVEMMTFGELADLRDAVLGLQWGIKDWTAEYMQNYYADMPVTFYKQEFQAMPENFSKVLELYNSGIVIEFKCDGRVLSFRLNDGYTVIETGGWCIQGNVGRWLGMDNETHDLLKAHNKLVKV